jgi:hypothetical protein
VLRQTGGSGFVGAAPATGFLNEVITGLNVGTAYDFAVAASNNAGMGPYSAVLFNVKTLFAPATVITPGVGTITDTAGNVFSIDVNGNAIENNVVMPNATGIAKMEYYLGGIYLLDGVSGLWYEWNGLAFLGPVAAPPSSTPTSAVAAPALIVADTSNVGILGVDWVIPPGNSRGTLYQVMTGTSAAGPFVVQKSVTDGDNTVINI